MASADLRGPGVLAGAVCAGLLFAAGSAWADPTLTLPNDSIEKYKNRATITTEFEIHFAHKSPKKPSPSKPSNDGDIQIAGIAAELRMPAVAGRMNAAGQPKALAYANKGQKVQITANTNPDHIFQIQTC
jgi:hypothetical protein